MRALIFASILAALPYLALAADKSETELKGRWMGIVYQHNAQPYPAVMHFTSETEGISEYASFPCTGKLNRIEDRPGYVFTEQITYSKKSVDDGGCIDGMIRIDIYDNEMDWTWKGLPPYEDTIAIGNFYRMTPQQAE